MVKILFLFFVFYTLAILQTGFFAYFTIKGITVNFIFLLAVVFNILERPEKKTGIFTAFLGGFFLDVFSSFWFGFNTILLVLVALTIKLIFKKYLIPISQILAVL